MLLNIVTDNELIVSEVVKTILLVIITGAIIFNVIRLIRNPLPERRVLNIILLVLFSGMWIYVFSEFRIEADLLRHPVYVKGTTTGYCKVFARGTGIEFEYELDTHKVKLFLDFAPGLGAREVPDPYYGGGQGFERVLDLVEEAARGFLASVTGVMEESCPSP